MRNIYEVLIGLLSPCTAFSDKLQRRQEIMLELTPTQKVDVDSSREVPTIVISDQGALQLAPPGCFGQNCGAYTNYGLSYHSSMDSQTTYDPFAENYARPYPDYPPGRVITPSPDSTFNNQPYPYPSSRVGAAQSLNPAPNAGWFAPLIQTGTFQPALNGLTAFPSVPAMPATSTTSAPVAVPGSVPLNANVPVSLPTTGQVPAPAPLPVVLEPNASIGTAGSSAVAPPPPPAPPAPPASPAPEPSKEANPPPAEGKDEKRERGGENPKLDAGNSPPPPSPDEEAKKIADQQGKEKEEAAKKIADQQAKEKEEREKADAKNVPNQRRSLRSGARKTSTSSIASKRSTAIQRLRKRQVGGLDAVQDCPTSYKETRETLIPVTEHELAAIQAGTAEMISYPIIGQDGQEGDTVYDVVAVEPAPAEHLHTTLKDILEKGAATMLMEEDASQQSRSSGDGINRSQYTARSEVGEDESDAQVQKRDNQEREEARLPLIEQIGKSDLHKRLKHGT
jgi:hypothetical protein